MMTHKETLTSAADEAPRVRPSALLSFAAPIEGGKSTVSNGVARRLGAPRVSFGDYLRQVAQERGLVVTREALQDLGDRLVGEDVRSFCLNVLKQQPCREDRPLLVDGVRHVEILEIMRDYFKDLPQYLFYIEVDKSTQAARLQHDDLLHDKPLDELEKHPTELQVRSRLRDRASLVLDGTKKADEVIQEVIDFARTNGVHAGGNPAAVDSIKSEADHFFNQFDERGYFKLGDGALDVVFLGATDARFKGSLVFKGGLLVRAEMEGANAWAFPDGSPIEAVKFTLELGGPKPYAIFVDHGRLVNKTEVNAPASKPALLKSLRLAKNLFIHNRADGDRTEVDAAAITDETLKGALWLSPKPFEGLDTVEFSELLPARQVELWDASRAIEGLARQIPPGTQPTIEQYVRGANTFIKILDILNPLLPSSENDQLVEKAMRSLILPPWVINWDYELGTNDEGDEAIWIDFFSKDSIPRSQLGRFGSQIIPQIRNALTEQGIHRWPYIKLRTSHEQ